MPRTEEPASELTLRDSLPAGIGLDSVSASTRVGEHQLGGNFFAGLSTARGTNATASISTHGIDLRFQPGIFVDARWPLSNYEISAAHIAFGTGAVSVTAEPVSTIAFSSTTLIEGIESDMTARLRGAASNTVIFVPGYDPFSDPDLVQHLQQVVTAVSGGTSSQAGHDAGAAASGAATGAAPNAAPETTFEAGARFSINAPIETEQGGVMVRIPAGSHASFNAFLSGSQQNPAAARLRWLEVSGQMEIWQEGRLMATVNSAQVNPGVVLSNLQIRWPADSEVHRAGGTLEGLRTILQLGAIAGSSGDVANSLGRPGDGQQVAERMGESRIIAGLQPALQQMIRDNAGAMPNVNLLAIVGMQ